MSMSLRCIVSAIAFFIFGAATCILANCADQTPGPSALQFFQFVYAFVSAVLSIVVPSSILYYGGEWYSDD